MKSLKTEKVFNKQGVNKIRVHKSAVFFFYCMALLAAQIVNEPILAVNFSRMTTQRLIKGHPRKRSRQKAPSLLMHNLQGDRFLDVQLTPYKAFS